MPLYFILPEAIQLADEFEEQYEPGFTLEYRSTDEPEVLRSMVVGTRYNFLDQDGRTTPAVLAGIILGHGTIPEGDLLVTSNDSMRMIPMNALVSISSVPAESPSLVADTDTQSASSSSNASRGISAPAAGGRRKSRRKSRRKKRKKTRKRIYKKYKRKNPKNKNHQ